MNINGITRTAVNAEATKGFPEFVEKLESYPLNLESTISSVLGSDVWNTLDRSERISLGKAIKSNIECGNLKGILPISTPAGQNQKYKRVGIVEMLTVFTCDYWGDGKSIEEILKANQALNNYAFVKCWFKVNSKEDSVELYCEALNIKGDSLFNAKPFKKELDFFVNQKIERGNSEFKAILALWYAFDRVFENRDELKANGINSICFLAPNEQMMRRIGGLKFNTSTNSYDYTEFIQRNFAQFREGELREIPFRKGIISLLNNEIK